MSRSDVPPEILSLSVADHLRTEDVGRGSIDTCGGELCLAQIAAAS